MYVISLELSPHLCLRHDVFVLVNMNCNKHLINCIVIHSVYLIITNR